MSRIIDSKKVNTDEFKQSKNSSKVLITKYGGKNTAFLIKDGMLTAMRCLSSDRAFVVGDIYIGLITKVSPEISAYFVQIAPGVNGFLHMGEAENPYIVKAVKDDGKIRNGDIILVQIKVEAQKGKLCSLTCNIELSDEAVVCCAGDGRVSYSKKLKKTEIDNLDSVFENDSLINRLKDNSLSIVVRTKAAQLEPEVVYDSAIAKLTQYEEILNKAKFLTLHSKVYSASRIADTISQIAASDEYDEIVTDDLDVYNDLKTSVDVDIRLYNEPMLSLSKLYSLESKADEAFEKKVWLKSGAFLYIEYTEAMTVIDVNSGKTTSKDDNVAFDVNVEAAREIARHLRLRNLSGIIIIDFINDKDNNARLLECMKTFVKDDPVGTSVHDITELGLMELTRKKSYKTLREQY